MNPFINTNAYTADEAAALNFFGAVAIPVMLQNKTVSHEYARRSSSIKTDFLFPKSVTPTSTNTKTRFFSFGKQRLTNVQIKTLVKSGGGVMTNDISLADYVILDERSSYSYEFGNSYMYTVIYDRSTTYNFVSFSNSPYDIRKTCGTFDSFVSFDYNSTSEHLYKISDLVSLHKISQMANGVKTVSPEDLEKYGNLKTEVTSELVDQLIRMFPKIGDDNTLANELVINIDFSKDPYELWRLSRSVGDYYFNKRSKRIRKFLEDTNFYRLSSLTYEEYFIYLERSNALYPKAVFELEKQLRSRVTVKNAHIYSFTFKIKPEYLELIEQHLKNIKDESNET